MVNKAQRFDGGGFQLDEDTAMRQIKLVEDAQKIVDESRKTMASLGEGQTPVVWTEDGKSVDLTAELKRRYDASGKWLDAISADLATARENISKAIDETQLLNEAQKVHYQNLLYRTTGTTSNGPIAV
ncbi:hypothetical protein Q9R19_00670 [Microbacterium sp. ARD32]|uniref:hypothetical protein n=1 Tax=Microbacterium sp. ARD32 TaxID=2962577 RepID=UPI0028828A2C|nr:hypothetical protein [Microbacterium sp. ARD32]MDT0156133.1 hypothetical protein [Microbacterium sp. ARD32]